MNKKAIVLLLAVVGAMLFHKQSIGINIFVFTVASSIWVYHYNLVKEGKKLLLAILVPLLSSIYLCLYPQTISFIVWLFSYLLMWSYLAKANQPLIIFIQSLTSVLSSPFINLGKWMEGLKTVYNDDVTQSKNANKIWIYLISFALVIVFSSLYISSNPVLSETFEKIDLSFFELSWFRWVFFLFLALFGLVIFERNSKIEKWNLIPLSIVKSTENKNDDLIFKIGRLSILALSILITIVNVIDLSILFTGSLPEGMTYSEYVHQGFNTLIFTMALAVILLLFFFKSQVNFHSAILSLKRISYLWITQNLLMLFIAAYKNAMYVNVYGLTYKRIAVFFGLLCLLGALILVYQKIQKTSSNWFFFNRLAHYTFISLFILSLIPIDYTICHYNLKYSETQDISYLKQLSHPDIQLVLEYCRSKNNGADILFLGELQTTMWQHQRDIENKNWMSWSLYKYSLKDLKFYEYQ